MIYYRNLRLVEESHQRHPLLVTLMHALDLEAEKLGWKKVVVTSMWRTRAENKVAGAKTLVHCQKPIRAADIRIRDQNPEVVEMVGKALNGMFQYDPKQPRLSVALWRLHGTGPHIHLQVHANTKRRLR